MSLPPGEQRALAGIEDTLRRSDPRLAAMLTTFTPPLAFRLALCPARAFLLRVARALAVALVLPTGCVIVMSWLVISQPPQPGCPPGMHASTPGQTGGFCDRAGASAVQAGNRAAAQIAAFSQRRRGWPGAQRPTHRGPGTHGAVRRDQMPGKRRRPGAGLPAWRLPGGSTAISSRRFQPAGRAGARRTTWRLQPPRRSGLTSGA